MDQERVEKLSAMLLESFPGFVLSTNTGPNNLVVCVDREAYGEQKHILCRAIEDFDPFLNHEYVMVN